MWWLLGIVIAGIIGIAKAILDSLQAEVAVERQRWEATYKQKEAEIRQYQYQIDQLLRAAQNSYNFKQLTDLHQASRRAADSTHGIFKDAQKTLDAMGRAIVSAAQQRHTLEQRKRDAWLWDRGNLEREIMSLHKLRDEILIPDKNKVKADRDRLKAEVDRLNIQTGQLRDMIGVRCGAQGKAWYDALQERTRIRQENEQRARIGLQPLPLPSAKPKQIENRVRGVVKWYDQNKQYGFITTNSGKDIHVSRSNLDGITFLQQGEHVEFVIREGNRGSYAARVVKLR